MSIERAAGGTPVPLARKLGIGEGALVLAVDAPPGLSALLAPLPDGARVVRRLPAGESADVALLFRVDSADLGGEIRRLSGHLTPAGGLWVCTPKRSSGVRTSLDQDTVRAAGLDAGLVDNKICSVDATWTGVRFVVRLRDRPGS